MSEKSRFGSSILDKRVTSSAFSARLSSSTRFPKHNHLYPITTLRISSPLLTTPISSISLSPSPALLSSSQRPSAMPPKHPRKRTSESYESDNGFIADAPKTKKTKATTSKAPSNTPSNGKKGKNGAAEAQGEEFWEVNPHFWTVYR